MPYLKFWPKTLSCWAGPAHYKFDQLHNLISTGAMRRSMSRLMISSIGLHNSYVCKGCWQQVCFWVNSTYLERERERERNCFKDAGFWLNLYFYHFFLLFGCWEIVTGSFFFFETRLGISLTRNRRVHLKLIDQQGTKEALQAKLVPQKITLDYLLMYCTICLSVCPLEINPSK